MRNDQLFFAHAPWKERFRTSTIFWTELARAEPTRGLAVSNHSGVFQLCAWHVPTGELRQLTRQPGGKLWGAISPDGRWVYYHADAEGNEVGHFVRVPFEGGEPEDITPDLPPYIGVDQVKISQAGNCLAFTAATSAGFRTYCLDVGPDGKLGCPREVHRSLSLSCVLAHSAGGEMVAVASTERSGSVQLQVLAVDTQNGQIINELWDGETSSITPGPFSPLAGDMRLLAMTDRTGVNRPLIWNPRTGERIDLALDEVSGEVQPLAWSADGTRLLLCHVAQAVHQLYLYDVTAHTLKALQHPAGSYAVTYAAFAGTGLSFGPDDAIFVLWMDSTHPAQVLALDGETGTRQRTVLAAGEAPQGYPWRSVQFASSDGQLVQGWLAVPDGPGPFPTILEMHGGPQAVETESFSPASQAWLDAGFAYLTINYRGSTTFGRAFEQQIWGNLGHWEVEDMVAARQWLLEQGIARAQQVFLTGWSYGGYLALLALGKRPDLWAGGMAGIAVADWAMLYAEGGEAIRGYVAALFKGTPEEKPEQYATSSPSIYAEQVSAPVLIFQGRHDTRTPSRQMERYEAQMKALGKEIEVKWFEAGHLAAFGQVEQAIEHQEWMLRFASRVLGQP